MREGTILLWKSHGFLGWCIKKVTGMPYGHSATYLYGFTWESTVWWSIWWFKTGIRVSEGMLKADEYWAPKEPETPSQLKAELRYFLDKLNKRRPYNVPKLLILALVIPCRKFFERLHWVPFDNASLGEVCSVTTDEAKKAAGIDLLPEAMEGMTAPGDFRHSKLLEQVG